MSDLLQSIPVTFDFTDSLTTASEWLSSLPSIVALDFEASKKHTPEMIASLEERLATTTDYLEQRELMQTINSTALSHPHHVFPTHLSIGITESIAKVIIISTYEMLDLVMEWLVTTDITQIWHNFNYDGKLIYHYSGGRLPRNLEDTSVLAKTILNHVENSKAEVGLKELAKKWYHGWGISADYFDYTYMFDEKVLRYAATDGCATMKLWTSITEYLETGQPEPYSIHTRTSDNYSPWSLLPAAEPRTVNPPYGQFYDTVAKHLIKDLIRIQMNGLPIDLQKVRELEEVLDTTLEEVQTSLQSNPLVHRFQRLRFKSTIDAYIEERRSHLKPASDFLTTFDPKNMEHRSHFMAAFSISNELPQPSELSVTGVPKWPIALVKKFTSRYPILQRMLDGQLTADTSEYVRTAMQTFAESRAAIANRTFLHHISEAEQGRFSTKVDFKEFNPSSTDHKHGILTDMLGHESEKLTDAYKKYEREVRDARRFNRSPPPPPKNKYSWDRDNLELLLKTVSDEDEIALLQALVDHSAGSIIKNNFIQAFYEYTIEGRLHGSLRLFGAKSFRLTSKDPNLLNLPSTGSIYSKPTKKCFIAPPGYIVLAIDYGALEDRVIASLTRDTNKCNIFLEGLDG